MEGINFRRGIYPHPFDRLRMSGGGQLRCGKFRRVRRGLWGLVIAWDVGEGPRGRLASRPYGTVLGELAPFVGEILRRGASSE